MVESGVKTVSVIMPFFQRESGILIRSLNSVKMQAVPDGWRVEVILIDDGSPISAEEEMRGVAFSEPFRLKMIRTVNGGVGAARNRGLAEVANAGSLIAFLDSDDAWPGDHLLRAIQAMEEGFDFYFTDNRRQGHHDSHCRSSYLPKTKAFLNESPQKSGFLEIAIERMVGLTLGEFPCQASTVVYRRCINDRLFFNTELTFSGEDVLFFTTLVASVTRVCLDLDSVVECGGGVNIYFSNLTWGSPKYLAITVDRLVMRHLIAERPYLSRVNKDLNGALLYGCRTDLAFHMLRDLLKRPTSAFREIKRLARMAPAAALVLPLDMTRVAVGHLTRPRRCHDGEVYDKADV